MGLILIAMKPDAVPEATVKRMRAIAPHHELLVSANDREIESRLSDIEIVFGEAGRKHLPQARNLKWFQQSGAGADWVMNATEIQPGSFTLTSASGVHGVPITEQIMAYLLIFSRAIGPSIRGQKGRIWKENREQPRFELDGKRCLLVGVGAIGMHFARVASAFGMEVVGVRRTPSAEQVGGTVRVVSLAELDAELPQAEILVITLPLTPETRHLFGRRRLSLLPRGVFVVNIGRGAVIKEDDLIALLDEGHIGGAGLDVFETEPLPPESPLWDMENVIITPHFAGITPRYDERLWEIFLDNLERYVAGRPLRNVVDWKLGY